MENCTDGILHFFLQQVCLLVEACLYVDFWSVN
uniref:Uncharacterized protein n=1 Tax=Anguilla anguilla TaxID=7936 RepID=A0A0E9UA20_ANGAN